MGICIANHWELFRLRLYMILLNPVRCFFCGKLLKFIYSRGAWEIPCFKDLSLSVRRYLASPWLAFLQGKETFQTSYRRAFAYIKLTVMIVSWGINTEVVGLNKVKCLWLKLDCLYIYNIYICVYIYIPYLDSYINYIFELTYNSCKYFYTQVCIAYINDICTYMYIFTSQFIHTIPRHAYTIHTTPILRQTSHTFSRMFVAGAQGCFAPQAPKVRKGWGLMGWIGEISRRW